MSERGPMRDGYPELAIGDDRGFGPSEQDLVAELVGHLNGRCEEMCPYCYDEWRIRRDDIEGVTLEDIATDRWYEESTHDDDECPEHGRQEIVDYGSTGGPDPYAVQKLACGHAVACFGPGESNIILDGWKPRPW